jgi:hypothetical protein
LVFSFTAIRRRRKQRREMEEFREEKETATTMNKKHIDNLHPEFSCPCRCRAASARTIGKFAGIV